MIFGDILGAVFGEGPETTTGTIPLLSPEQQKQLDELLQFTSPPDEGSYVTPYEGQLSTGLSDLELQSLAGLERQLQGIGSDPIYGAIDDAYMALLSGTPVDYEQAYKTNVEDPLLESFSESVIPELQVRNAGNFYSSDALSAEEVAYQELVDELEAGRSQYAYSSEQAALDRQLQALGLAPQITGLETDLYSQILDSAGIQREVEQAGLDREYLEFARQQDALQAQMDDLLTALRIPTVEPYVTQTQGDSGLLGAFVGSSGGSAFLGDLAASIFL